MIHYMIVIQVSSDASWCSDFSSIEKSWKENSWTSYDSSRSLISDDTESSTSPFYHHEIDLPNKLQSLGDKDEDASDDLFDTSDKQGLKSSSTIGDDDDDDNGVYHSSSTTDDNREVKNVCAENEAITNSKLNSDDELLRSKKKQSIKLLQIFTSV